MTIDKFVHTKTGSELHLHFDWHDEKARKNLARHKISFEVARAVWNDPLQIIAPDRRDHGEERWVAIGMVGPVAILVVVHTYPDLGAEERVRIIGARKASKHERKHHEQDGSER